jgi:hypothetical protein
MTIQDFWTIEELDFYTWCVSGVILHWNPTSWETNNLMSEFDTYCDMQVASCITVMQEHARTLKHRPRIATPSCLPLSNKSICSKHTFHKQTNTITKCVVSSCSAPWSLFAICTSKSAAGDCVAFLWWPLPHEEWTCDMQLCTLATSDLSPDVL